MPKEVMSDELVDFLRSHPAAEIYLSIKNCKEHVVMDSGIRKMRYIEIRELGNDKPFIWLEGWIGCPEKEEEEEKRLYRELSFTISDFENTPLSEHKFKAIDLYKQLKDIKENWDVITGRTK